MEVARALGQASKKHFFRRYKVEEENVFVVFAVFIFKIYLAKVRKFLSMTPYKGKRCMDFVIVL